MLSALEFRRIVGDQRQDLFARCLRSVLGLASVPYGFVVDHRNRRFDAGQREQHRVNATVICVGNLTVGGTGKTPMVAYLCRWFQARNANVAIVSRGYGANEDQQNDEARELRLALPDVPHIQDPDRVAAAQTAIEQYQAQVIVMDDGFQHRRLMRDLDLVLLDALEPFGFDHLLPRGLLREPVQGLQRAHVVGLTRANLVSSERRAAIRERVAKLATGTAWLELEHVPTELTAGEHREPLSSIAEKRVVAFCGLGNPAGFRQTLDACGAEVVEFLEFPDHHAYDSQDLEAIQRIAVRDQPDLLLCTQKDWVKIGRDELGGISLRALAVQQQVIAGQRDLEVRLERLLAE